MSNLTELLVNKVCI